MKIPYLSARGWTNHVKLQPSVWFDRPVRSKLPFRLLPGYILEKWRDTSLNETPGVAVKIISCIVGNVSTILHLLVHIWAMTLCIKNRVRVFSPNTPPFLNWLQQYLIKRRSMETQETGSLHLRAHTPRSPTYTSFKLVTWITVANVIFHACKKRKLMWKHANNNNGNNGNGFKPFFQSNYSWPSAKPASPQEITLQY